MRKIGGAVGKLSKVLLERENKQKPKRSQIRTSPAWANLYEKLYSKIKAVEDCRKVTKVKTS